MNGWKQEYPYRYDRDLARRELLPQAVIEELERATAGDAWWSLASASTRCGRPCSTGTAGPGNS